MSKDPSEKESTPRRIRLNKQNFAFVSELMKQESKKFNTVINEAVEYYRENEFNVESD